MRGFVTCLRDQLVFDPSYDPGDRIFADCLVAPVLDDDGNPMLVQGVSAGLGFVGSPVIDVNGLAPGQYWLEVEVNPRRLIVESDYGNNISRARIEL